MESEHTSLPHDNGIDEQSTPTVPIEIVEGSHYTFSPDGWQQIESLNTDVAQNEINEDHPEISFDFGAVLETDIIEATKKAQEMKAKSEDASFAEATANYLRALQRSYRELQATSPHLSAELIKEMGESKACRELCAFVSQTTEPSAVDFKAIELAANNVNWNAIPIDEANALFDSITGAYKSSEDAIAEDEPLWQNVSNSPAQAILSHVPTQKMQELFLYVDENDTPSAFARYMDADTLSESQLVQKAKFFLYATDPQNGLSDMQHHPVIGRLVERLGGTEAAKIVDGESDLLDLPSFKSAESEPANLEVIDRHNRRYERAIQDYLVSNLALSRELITAISDAMKSRLRDTITFTTEHPEDNPDEPATSTHMIYQQRRVVSAMLRIGENVRLLGAQTIERLHSELGVVNIDRYAPEDLKTMVKLLDKDPETIENLQNGDVMTVMSDTYGDWNGAFNSSLDNVRRDSGRALLFEVAKPSDLYRHMIFLKQRGIKPSSLSINAHGLPGLTQFGSSSIGGGFYLAAGMIAKSGDEQTDKKDLNVSLYEANLSRLFSEEFFQPSRGIDDASDWIGSTQIIINSCSSDVANEEWTHSTAEVIAAKIAKPDDTAPFSVIGASDVLYVVNRPEGLHFVNENDEGIGVKIDAKIIHPTRQEKIIAALKRQQATAKLSIVRTNYAVIPVSNTFRKVA